MIFTALAVASCIAVSGPNITARDLAKAVPGFTPVDADAVVGYAPEPGVERVFHGAELRQSLLRLDYYVSGELPDVCFARPMAQMKQTDVLAAMKAALGPAATIQIVELSHAPVPAGQLVFSREELGNPPVALWHGYVLYDGTKRFPIWARVTATVEFMRAVAVTELRPGVPIQSGQVAFATVDDFPQRRSTPQSEAQVEGCLPKRFIAANTPVWSDSIDPPNDVLRGDHVAVSVSSGLAHLIVDAEAQGSGRRGDLIALKNPESGKIFHARVNGRGTAALEAASVKP